MRFILATALLIAGIAAAVALTPEQQIILFGGNSSASGGGIVLTNQRITNTGAFRTTNTTANRAVFP